MRFPLLKTGFIATVITALIVGCSAKNSAPVTPAPTQPLGTPLTTLPADVAVTWANMSLRITAKTLSNTPTYASRAFGYLGLGMYEATVYGIPDHQSLAGQLTDLTKLPRPEIGKVYDWSVSLNACEASLLKNLYPHAPANQLAAVDSLETALQERLTRSVATDVVARSVSFGKAIADALFEWSKTDGGYEGYKNPFPTDYKLPTGEGYWVAPTDGQVATARALHPRWGNNRTFAAANAALPIPKMPATFSRDPASDYYKMYKAVYDQKKQLTQADKEAAIWWSDDPSQTFTPPGHSYNLATIAIRTKGGTLAQAVETYARAGMAVADAFICCFKCKYTYVNERPSWYIRLNVEQYWSPFWPEPPFPGFPSGHSTQGAATATVLADLYGTVHFTDDSHVGRPSDAVRNVDFKARSFNSFWEAAEESGWSRILGGIHTQQDNEVGLNEGKKIGGSINSLVWKK